MAALNTQQPEALDSQNRGRSAGQSAPQLSNLNPFRRRGNSPGGTVSPPTSPFDDPIEEARPVSRNPFLDPSQTQATPPYASRSLTDRKTPMATASAKPDVKSATPEELFDALTIDDKEKQPQSTADTKAPAGNGAGAPPSRPGPPSGPSSGPSFGPSSGPMPRPRPPMGRGGPPGPRGPPRGPPGPRGENMPPPRFRGPPGHRPSHSQEEALRARRGPPGGAPHDPTSPQRRMDRRPRRNSDSSVVDSDKLLTEEEKKAREARRQARQRDAAKDRAKPVNRKLDLIDQLDATSIYGTGLFHHDGPFDALNPHRNRQGSRRAPMQAFPKDSLNNSIGGPGPLNARPDHATFMGTAGEEAYKEFTSGPSAKDDDYYSSKYKTEMPVFDPMSRGTILHGDETLGLGTSTFLEGAPATRVAIQRREAEQKQETMDNSLKRNKSIAQRIRNINRGAREPPPSARPTNAEGGQSAPATTTATGERNPFDEFEAKKDDVITVARRRASDAAGAGTKSPTSPKRVFGLERRATAEGASAAPDEPAPPPPPPKGTASSLLARVKSLKGGRKPRTNEAPPGPPPPGPAA